VNIGNYSGRAGERKPASGPEETPAAVLRTGYRRGSYEIVATINTARCNLPNRDVDETLLIISRQARCAGAPPFDELQSHIFLFRRGEG
jgi:hypothetical protein